MSKRIDKQADDQDAGIRFHMSSARMSIAKVSYVAFQRFLDDMERSMYRCPECKWHGRGRDLVPMEADSQDLYSLDHSADCWYACPVCECEVAADRPIMKSVV